MLMAFILYRRKSMQILGGEEIHKHPDREVAGLPALGSSEAPKE